MMKNTELISKDYIEKLAKNKKDAILNAQDSISVCGNTYYVTSSGDDSQDGKTEATAWKTLTKVSTFPLEPGDAVRFKRGDLFRGSVITKPGVTYCAYGCGEKPKFYGWNKDLASKELWEQIDNSLAIWRYREKITDCGTLVFDSGAAHSRKLIPSYRDGRFVCRDNENEPFDVRKHMDKDLDIFCEYDAKLTSTLTKDENFPVPLMDKECYGNLYLRCEKGNPGEVFNSIEAIPWSVAFVVAENENVTIDNLCINYSKFAVSACGDSVKGLKVTNFEIGWIGGNIQHYLGLDPNFPEGRHGTVTRYGNGIEIYGGCDGYEVSGCYIYQCYDAGITHQISTNGNKFEQKNILYKDNLIENCVYSIEYFLDDNKGKTDSIIKNCKIDSNIMRLSGYGWGQQRHNVDTPAHIKGWSYANTATDFEIRNNILDRAAYKMIHLVAASPDYCPKMHGNTYIQKSDFPLGQYGANCEIEPEIITFDKNIENSIKVILKENDARILVV